jgi:hypothetical protein
MANVSKGTRAGFGLTQGHCYQRMIWVDGGRQFDLMGATLFNDAATMRLRT